ncbi:hypothetical protein [Pontibacter ramchanderi]|uniref:hypothetical protein n=1 Tax=Pontibacter ramchanderi TaxID=1179743 RepID=UPI00117EC3E6|nr:hypothetical protein [Pontibacter ramchanderi]
MDKTTPKTGAEARTFAPVFVLYITDQTSEFIYNKNNSILKNNKAPSTVATATQLKLKSVAFEAIQRIFH